MNQKPNLSTKTIYVLVIIAASLLLLATIYISGYMRYGFAYVRCGGAPVMVRPTFEGVGGYVTSEDRGWYTVNPFTKYYYCSVGEAESAGYEPSLVSEEGQRRLQKKNEQLQQAD